MMNRNTTREVTVEEGYARWSAQYDQEDNALIMLEEQLTGPLLASLAVRRVLDLEAGTSRYAICFAAS